MDLISYLLRLDSSKFSNIEKHLLEIKLFVGIYRELHEIFKRQYMDYQRLIKTTPNQEESMLSINFEQEMIKDILSTKEYSLSGIATHTFTPEEVVYDIASGINTDPTCKLSRKLFELHMTVRRNLYDAIVQKIISQYSIPTSFCDEENLKT